MTLQERIIQVLEGIEKYYPEELDKIKNIIKNTRDESTLIKELELQEERIKKYKETYTNAYYANEQGETYYADIEEDEHIYDSNDPEDAKVVEEALKKATEKYVDIKPSEDNLDNSLLGKILHRLPAEHKFIDLAPILELNNEKEYSNLIRVDVIYDEQIGYRVIENENGLFHAILIESTYYIYPSRKINLNDPEHIEICNTLFKGDKKVGLALGDEIEFDGIEPATIFMPFVGVAKDPINQTTYSDILIGEGVLPGTDFENGLVVDKTQPRVKNILTKGKINTKTKEKEGFGFQEDIIVEPQEYSDGTLIPIPRPQRDDELNSEYADYLENYYKNLGYRVTYDENGNPIYPHSISNPEHETLEITETFEERFGLERFLDSIGQDKAITEIEPMELMSYLKAYKAYLEKIKISNPEHIETVNAYIEDININIEQIKERKLHL